MIYLDTSALLAELFAEDRHPPESIWSEPLVVSRLLEYEIWVRVHARGLVASHGEAARDLVARFAMLDLTPEVLTRALESSSSTCCSWSRSSWYVVDHQQHLDELNRTSSSTTTTQPSPGGAFL